MVTATTVDYDLNTIQAHVCVWAAAEGGDPDHPHRALKSGSPMHTNDNVNLPCYDGLMAIQGVHIHAHYTYHNTTEYSY